MQLNVLPGKGRTNTVDVKMKVKILVQQVLESYLKEQLEKKTIPITILLNDQSMKPAIILDVMVSLIESYNVIILASKEWVPLLKDRKWPFILMEEMSQHELQAVVGKTSLLVIPVGSYRLISKLALTMDDDLGVWLAIQYQLDGKPIVIANDHVELNVYQLIHAPHSVQERLRSYIRQIQADRVKWVPLHQLFQTVNEQVNTYEEKKTLILEKHIEAAHRDGMNEILVPPNSQMTPAARDLAKELKIQISKLTPRKEDS